MRPLFAHTLGILPGSQYFRHFFFGLIWPLLFAALFGEKLGAAPPAGSAFFVAYAVLSTLLYPYSRFVYERFVGFLMGDNVFVLNFAVWIPLKLFTMGLCWLMAIVVAPIAWLGFYIRKTSA